jgi:hypothetical protein
MLLLHLSHPTTRLEQGVLERLAQQWSPTQHPNRLPPR